MKVLNNVNDSTNYHKKYEHGIQKPRGLENAAIQRNKHRDRQPEVAKTQVPKDVAEISSGTGEEQKTVTDSNSEDISNNTTYNVVVDGTYAKFNINSHVNVDNGNDTLIIGADADVKINSHVGTDNGDDMIVVGDGARLNLNSHVNVDNGNDTLIIGADADVKINSHTFIDSSDSTFFIPAQSKENINMHETREAFRVLDNVGRENETHRRRKKTKDNLGVKEKEDPKAVKDKNINDLMRPLVKRLRKIVEDGRKNLAKTIENNAKNHRDSLWQQRELIRRDRTRLSIWL